MNVNANIIESLRSKLSPADFAEFVHDVKLDNNPALATFEDWLNTEQADTVVKALAGKVDELGFVTSQDVQDALESDGESSLVWVSFGGDAVVVGTRGGVEDAAKRMKMNTYISTRAFNDLNDYAAKQAAKAVTRRLVDAGVLARADYLKDTNTDSPRRCYTFTHKARVDYCF